MNDERRAADDRLRMLSGQSSVVGGTKAMRHDLIDSLIIGSTIALIVLAIHALADGAAGQLQLLALAGCVLFCVQLTLTIYRARRSGQPPAEQATPPRRLVRRRRDRSNPFARELTHDWIGLDEHIVERDMADLELAKDHESELAGDQTAIDEKSHI